MMRQNVHGWNVYTCKPYYTLSFLAEDRNLKTLKSASSVENVVTLPDTSPKLPFVPTLPGGTSAAIVPQSPVFPLQSFPQALGLISTHKATEPLPLLNKDTGEVLKGVAPNILTNIKASKFWII